MNRGLVIAPNWIVSIGLLAMLLVLPVGAATPTPSPEATKTQGQTGLMPVPLQPGEKLRVLATTSIVGDVVKQVGGDYIDISILLPIGTDPHTFEPTPKDVAAIADVQAIFANGAGLEEFLDKMLKNAGGSAPVVQVSEGIALRQMSPGEIQAEEQSHQSGAQPTLEAGHTPVGADPHTWFTPVNVMVWVRNIGEALSALDPSHAAEYRAQAVKYHDALAQMDTWIQEQVAQIPPDSRSLVTDHLTFGYYADRYGFQQIGAVIPSFSTAAQASARELAQLEDAIRQHEVKAVFASNTVNPSLSQRVAEDMGVQLVTVYHGSLGAPGSGVESYLDLLRYDTMAIVNALK